VEAAELIERIYAAFSAAPRPDADEITPHRCWECDEVRDRLNRYQVREVPIDDMEWIGDCLPLLSPKALRYYLPRYLEYSITHQSSNARDFVLFHLSAEDPSQEYWSERYAAFSAPEQEAILHYLRYRATSPDAEFDQEALQRALEYWQRAQQAHAGDVRDARA
jgi:hypothetical protein